MQMISKFWIRALFVLGGGMLFYAFHYDVSRTGGFSWDDPPELMEPYLPQIAVADRLYQVGWTICGVAAAGFFVRAMVRIARAEHGAAGKPPGSFLSSDGSP
jgi:hypothetical protein